MLAVLNRPLVTDYVPAVKPPWVLLALAVGILAVWLPRESLPEVLLASAAVVVVGSLVNWLWARYLPAGDDAADGPDSSGGDPAAESHRRAA